MPLFMFVSGYFSKRFNVKSLVKLIFIYVISQIFFNSALLVKDLRKIFKESKISNANKIEKNQRKTNL